MYFYIEIEENFFRYLSFVQCHYFFLLVHQEQHQSIHLNEIFNIDTKKLVQLPSAKSVLPTNAMVPKPLPAIDTR